jgi:hypothetical protein
MTSDGGPAFPSDIYYDEKPVGCDHGMSLRDYFAAKALAGWLGSFGPDDCEDDIWPDAIAEFAYKMADAMLQARKPKPEAK